MDRSVVYEPEFPISSCLSPSTSPYSTRAIVVLLMNVVNHPIKLTKPSGVVVNWRSMGSGGGFHYVCTPFELLQARTSPLVTSLHLSSPLFTSDDLKDIRYPGAGWSDDASLIETLPDQSGESPSIRFSTGRNTSRGNAISASRAANSAGGDIENEGGGQQAQAWQEATATPAQRAQGKRKEMKGYIRKRGDSWQLIYELSRDADGKRKQGRQTVHGTKRDADTKLREILTALDKGGYITPTKETVGAFLERWLESYGATNTSPRTLKDYRGIVRRYLTPVLGGHPIGSTTSRPHSRPVRLYAGPGPLTTNDPAYTPAAA